MIIKQSHCNIQGKYKSCFVIKDKNSSNRYVLQNNDAWSNAYDWTLILTTFKLELIFY